MQNKNYFLSLSTVSTKDSRILHVMCFPYIIHIVFELLRILIHFSCKHPSEVSFQEFQERSLLVSNKHTKLIMQTNEEIEESYTTCVQIYMKPTLTASKWRQQRLELCSKYLFLLCSLSILVLLSLSQFRHLLFIYMSTCMFVDCSAYRISIWWNDILPLQKC